MSFQTVAEWRNAKDAIPEKDYGWLEYQANTLAALILVPPEDLAIKFEEGRAKLIQSGISLNNAPPEAWDHLERWLGSEFPCIGRT